MQISARNTPLMQQSVARAEALIASDPQLRDAIATPQDLEHIAQNSRTSIEHMAALFSQFANRPCLGTRQGKGFATQTYAQVWHRSRRLAAACLQHEFIDVQGSVGVYGFASADWVVAHVAAHVLCATSVPLRTGLSADDLAYIINEAELTCIVASAELLPRLAAVLPQCPQVRGVIVMDQAAGAATNASGAANWPKPTLALSDVDPAGPLADLIVPSRDTRDTDPLMAILYTSGSTGRPKGAMYPESIYLRHVGGGLTGSVPRMPMVALGYLPLNHLAGLAMLYQTMNAGGLTHFVQKSDMSTLFDDMRAARPTFTMLVPRVADMIYQAYVSECVRRGSADNTDIQQSVMHSMRHTFLGDRLLFAVAGTAPTAPEVLTFLQDCFEIPVFNGYGATENASVTFEDRITRNFITDYKLVDVPELGYRSTDKPYPRGELRIKSCMLIPGYFKNPAATAELRDAEGYQKTGDIVEERGPDHVVWIDRKHNVLKLSQGEFVQVSQLENLYTAKSPFIEQVYLYGTSQRAYLLAVLVPNMRNVHARLGDPCSQGAVKDLLRQEVDRVARAAQVQSFEIPRDFLLQAEPFTKENGLLTESSKPARPQLKQAFSAQLEAMYEAVEGRSRAALQDLRDRTDMLLRDKVVACITATLGLANLRPDAGQTSFVSMGGDSLTAVQLSDRLRQVCGVTPPVGLLLDSNTSLAALIDSVEQLQKSASGPGERLDFAAVHGQGATLAKASDLQLSRFLPQVQADLPAPSAVAKNILLTGANGFLGRMLLLELLQHASEQGGTVTAVVRGQDNAAAQARVRAAFAESGSEVAGRLQRLSQHLQVLAGDLMLPRLGLAASTYDSLCDKIDTVLHNGALVNHALTYPQLFEPNVLGTVELMRLCTQKRKKAITFVSTVGVPAGANHTVTEDETGRMLWQERVINADYASGYGTSKWAAEVLLEQLASQHGIPVNVVRSGMIMAHTRLRGQVNTTDFVTRLLTGLVHTGVRPPSFYSGAGRHHFDGTPVDVVAAGIGAIALQERQGHQVFHAINTYDDGFSLDSFANVIEAAGYPLRTAPSYSAWYADFGAALERLERSVRDTTPYPILFQWQAPANSLGGTPMTNTRFRERVQRLTRCGDLPHLDAAFMHTTLQHMLARELIPEPPEARSAAAHTQESAPPALP